MVYYYDLTNLGYDCGGGVAAIGAITGGGDDHDDYDDPAVVVGSGGGDGRGSMIGGFFSNPVFGGKSIDADDDDDEEGEGQNDEDTEQDSAKIVPDSIRMMHATAAAADVASTVTSSKTEEGSTLTSECCKADVGFEQRNPYDPNCCSGSHTLNVNTLPAATTKVNHQYKMMETSVTQPPVTLPSRSAVVQRPVLSRAGSVTSTSCSSTSMSSVGSSIYQQRQQQQPQSMRGTTQRKESSSSSNPPSPTPTMIRRDLHVTFSTVTIRKIPHRLTYSKEEKLATWYNVQEFQSIRQSAMKLARSIESKKAITKTNSSKDCDDDDDENAAPTPAPGRDFQPQHTKTPRGLERLGKSSIKKLSARRRVLYSELKVLRELGWMDKDKSHAVLDDLAELFRGYTKISAEEARAMGQRDEMVAYKCYHDDLIAARRHLDGDCNGDDDDDEEDKLNSVGSVHDVKIMRRSPKVPSKTAGGHGGKSRKIEPPRHHHQHYDKRPGIVERQSSTSSSSSSSSSLSSLTSPIEECNVKNKSTSSYWDIVPSLFFG